MPLGIGLVLPGVTAAAGAPTISVDALDVAIAALPNLVAYSRPKRISDVNVSWTDRLGQTVTVAKTGAVKSAVDADFNSRESVDIAGCVDYPYKLENLVPTASFTFLAAVRRASLGGAVNHLFGCSSGFTCYASNTAGQLAIDADWGDTTPANPDGVLSGPAPTVGATELFWLSHDAVTKITRVGKASITPTGSVTHADAHAPNSTHRWRPFGFFNTPASADSQFQGKWGFFAVMHQAIGNGGAGDVAFANALAVAKTFYGI